LTNRNKNQADYNLDY